MEATRTTKRNIFVCFSFLLQLLLANGTVAWADEMTAKTVMKKVDARDDGDRSIAEMTMLLIDRHGKQRSRTIRSFSLDKADDTYSLMFFLTPADVTGTGFLTYDYDETTRDDDQWLYLPALKKNQAHCDKR